MQISLLLNVCVGLIKQVPQLFEVIFTPVPQHRSKFCPVLIYVVYWSFPIDLQPSGLEKKVAWSTLRREQLAIVDPEPTQALGYAMFLAGDDVHRHCSVHDELRTRGCHDVGHLKSRTHLCVKRL